MPFPSDDPPFKGLRQFNTPDGRRQSGLKHRVAPQWMHLFPGDGLPSRLAHALAARAAIDLKELCESFEFFTRTRRRVRAPVMADLCCGHGFNGLLFALFERKVERMYLIDKRRPKSFDPIYEAVLEVGPWVEGKITWLEEDIKHADLPEGCAVLGVHACGGRTDTCVDVALTLGGPIAVMPCCYGQTAPDAPPALHEVFGREVATDIHRTYRLETGGYGVEWSYIPKCVTPMNRILIGRPGASHAAKRTQHAAYVGPPTSE